MIIDDSSPSIVYSGQWYKAGVEQEYNHTTHGSWTKGSKATVSFTGRSIQVYGTIGRNYNNGDPAFAPTTLYAIDGQNDSTFTGTPSRDQILYKQRFYKSPKLSSGQHELVVTLTTSNMDTMWIDYFQVETPATVSPGLIGGVVVGGIVGIALLIIGILLRRISQQKQRRVPQKATQTYWPWTSRSPGQLTPFGSDPFSHTQTHNGAPHPFSIEYTPYSLESSEPSDLSNGTSFGGYATWGGTSANKLVSSPTPIAFPTRASSHSKTTRDASYSPHHTVQANSTQAGRINRPSRPSNRVRAGAGSRRNELLSSPSASSDLRPRPFLGVTTDSRVVVEKEEPPPAYSMT